MLKKLGAEGGGQHSAANGPDKAAERRTWADVRARLRQGRSEGARRNEPAPEVQGEVADDAGHRPAAANGHAGAETAPATPDSDAAPAAPPVDQPGAPTPSVEAEAAEVEVAVADAPPEPVSAPDPAPDEPSAGVAAPDAEAETANSGPGADRGASSEPTARAADDEVARAEAPAPVAEAPAREAEPAVAVTNETGPLIGRVISVAGSVVWGVLEVDVADLAEIGAVVRLHNARGRTVGLITTLKTDGRGGGRDENRLVEIRMLGEILSDGPAGGRFQRGVSSHPSMDSAIHAATRAELEAIYAPPEAATVRLGCLSHTSSLPAYAITDNLLGKHFAVLGSTGAGKSCAVTVILRAILDANPYGHVVMLDPHNEYGRAFDDRSERLNPTNLKLPYWLLNYEELAALLISNDNEHAYAEAAILKDALLAARRQFVGADHDVDHVTVDTPMPYRLSELVKLIKEAMGAFNRPESTAAYQHLISRIESLSSDKRYEFMFSSFLVQDTMHHVLSRILRIPVETKPITIIDISGVPSEIVDVVVSVLFRLIFEFALWSDRAKAPPILLVCEEAHRYVPGDDQVGFAPTKRSISRIAKEGRKYGLSLGLVTQRPSELSTSSLSQCNTIFALRLSNDRDLEFVRAAVTDSSRWLTDTLPALNTQEAVVLGDGVSVPMHIRFDELPPEHRPASTTPRFSAFWQGDVSSDPLIAETIEHWRHQIRASKPED